MKIKPASADPDAVPHGLKKVQIRNTRWGIVAQKRPGKPKKPPTKLQQQYRQRFALAARMASDPTSLDLRTAIEMAKGTEQVPRDILTMAALGRYYEIVGPDGELWGHVEGPTATAPDETPPPEPDLPPATDEDEMQWTHWDAAWSTATSGSAYAFKGVILTPRETRTLRALYAIFTADAAGTYRAAVGEIDAANKIVAVTLSEQVTVATTARQLIAWDIEAKLTAGTRSFLLFGRTDQTPTFALNCAFSDAPRWLWPVTHHSSARLAQTEPQIGHTLDTTGGNPAPPIGLKF